MGNLNNTVTLASILLAVILGSFTSSSSLTKNVEAGIENPGQTCEDSFLPKSNGGEISDNGLANLNAYLSQNPVAVGNEPLTNVKNVDGLCVLIQLMEQENPVEKQGNAEQIRNILNAALQEKSNFPEIEAIIDSLLNQGLIQPSDD